MARDLDFRVRRAEQVPSTLVKPVVKSPIVRRQNSSNKMLWAVLVLLLIAASIGIWQFVIASTPTVSSIKTTELTEQTPVASTPTPIASEESILSPQSTSPNVQIYDSGAGSTAVKSLADKLKALGYKVENLEKSQFDYDRTYIRYRAGLQAEAEKIQSTMPDRLVSLKEVVTAGLFDILILYGVK